MTTKAVSPLALVLAVGCSSALPSPAAPSAAPVLEPHTQQFVDAVAAQGGPPIYELTISEARAVLDGAQAHAGAAIPADVQDRTIPGGPRGAVSIRIVRPAGKAAAVLPGVVYFHGGGWILGNAATHDRLVRELANGGDAAIVFVNYTPSPEARFPVAIEEAYAATKYVAEHGADLGVDGSRLAVAGDSVGGNMAAVVTLLAKQRGGPALAHQLLFYPVTDASMTDASYERFQRGPWLTRPAMRWFFDAYAPSATDRANPLVSPLRAPRESLRGLPPATVITAENDVLRDEGEAYARHLSEAGVPVKAVRYIGTIHDFVMLNALAATPAARSALALATHELRAALAP